MSKHSTTDPLACTALSEQALAAQRPSDCLYETKNRALTSSDLQEAQVNSLPLTQTTSSDHQSPKINFDQNHQLLLNQNFANTQESSTQKTHSQKSSSQYYCLTRESTCFFENFQMVKQNQEAQCLYGQNMSQTDNAEDYHQGQFQQLSQATFSQEDNFEFADNSQSQQNYQPGLNHNLLAQLINHNNDQLSQESSNEIFAGPRLEMTTHGDTGVMGLAQILSQHEESLRQVQENEPNQQNNQDTERKSNCLELNEQQETSQVNQSQLLFQFSQNYQ